MRLSLQYSHLKCKPIMIELISAHQIS
uniref:Uncharacterized protein n=1 Tax=Rhizophora mucronata TaxID=61149 RepID=A0A2P2MEX6_RHIMU